MGSIGLMVGGLVPTFLLSRLFMWLVRRWSDGSRLAVAIFYRSQLFS